MIKESKEAVLGFDLCQDYSQLTVYMKGSPEPVTVSLRPQEEAYQIETPKNLLYMLEDRSEMSRLALSNFFRECFEKIALWETLDVRGVMVTMEKLRPAYGEAIREALQMLDIPRTRIYMQDHMESFFHYILHQKKELWNGTAALFEYKKDHIQAYELNIDYHTRPALAKTEQVFKLYVDEKAREGRREEVWRQEKDTMFLEQLKKMFQKKVVSSAYLLGEGFDRSWEERSLAFLCHRRHVFQGQNLYTKGACYGAMEQAGYVSLGEYLYAGPDMVEHNIGMDMILRGNESYYPMITAGVNCYMAYHACDFILDDTEEIVLHSKSMSGEELSHTIQLSDLPKRPNRATRIHMEVSFLSKSKCRVQLDDMGLGGLFPASGKKWEAVIEL